MKPLGAFLVKAAASCCYLSYLPGYFFKRSSRYTGSGFIGALFGLLSVKALPRDPLRLLVVLIGAVLIAVAISGEAEALMGRHDDPRIVIDEWAGMWFAMALVPLSIGTLLTGLILFRVFDTLKAPWVRKLAELPGGWGIVMDDVLAGLIANGILHVIIYIHPI